MRPGLSSWKTAIPAGYARRSALSARSPGVEGWRAKAPRTKELKIMEKFDVVIVGGGPAGTLTGWHAARAGASVLILEKRQEVGSPIRCGEGLDKRGIEKIGLTPSKKWIAHEVKGAHIIAPNGMKLKLTEGQAGNEVGYVVNRDVFDKEMAKLAIDAGAQLRVKTSVVELLRKDGKVNGVRTKFMGKIKDIEAGIVVGADGYESQIGRWAGIDTNLKPKDMFSCFQYHMVNIDIDPDYNDFYLGSCAPGGYAWMFVKGPDEANVGLGVQGTKLHKRGDVKRILDDFVKSVPGLAKGKAISHIAGAISACAPLDCVTADGILLIGDAARMIDPITGGGIINAGLAAKPAGEVAAEAVAVGDTSKEFLQKYEKGWRALIENKLWRNYMAKEKVTTFSDDTFNKIIEAIKDADMSQISSLELFKAVQAKYPELVKDFEDLLM